MSTNVNLHPELRGTPRPKQIHQRFGSDVSFVQREWVLANGKCPQPVSTGDWSGSHLCERPIKVDGAHLCNMHLSAERRAQEKAQARVEARALADDLWAQGDYSVQKLAALGIACDVAMRRDHTTDKTVATGGVSLSAEVVDELVARLGGMVE